MRKQRPTSLVSGDSMDDVAILLLVLFLAVTTFHTSQGIKVNFSSRDVPSKQLRGEKELEIFINKNSEIRIANNPAEIQDIPLSIYQFLLESNEIERTPIIFLSNSKEVNYNGYISVYNALNQGYHKFYDSISKTMFHQSFNTLSNEQIQYLHSRYPKKVREKESLL